MNEAGILSADDLRLRCPNHGAELSTDDGRPLGDAFVPCGLGSVPVKVDGENRVVIGAQAYSNSTAVVYFICSIVTTAQGVLRKWLIRNRV